jgi:hypothetical protein
MINGWHQWGDELAQHWQHALAASAAFRSTFPVAEFIRMAVVAALTTVATTYILTVRLDERQTQIKELMQHLAVDHAEFYRRIAVQEATLSRVEARQLDVRDRLNKLEAKR